MSRRRGRVDRPRTARRGRREDGAGCPRRWATRSWRGCASGGSSRSSPIPATASTASWPRSARPTTEPAFIQSRHEEMSAFQAVGYAKFSGKVGVCMATCGPGAIHLLNGLYDAKLDHVPVVAIVGQTERSAMGGSYQQEVDLQALFKDVASEYLVEVNVPEQLPDCDRPGDPHGADAARAHGRHHPERPADRDLQAAEARVQAGPVQPAAAARPARRRRPRRDRPRRRGAERRAAGRDPGRAGRAGRRGRGRAGRRRARRRRREGAAGQGRAQRRAAVRHRLDRPARHPAQLRADARLRHPADRRLQLPVQPVPARVRPTEGRPARCRSTSTAR